MPTASTAPDLLLKVTAPRVPRHVVARASLSAALPQFASRPVVLVQAPPGFGKTSLLAQWRREQLARGGIVAWLTAQAQDDPPRFVQSLALAVRVGSGRPTFGHVLLESTPARGLEGVTTWLAELAQSALDVVLFVDEVDRLPAASRELLAYVLRNAPTNLRCVLAARADAHLDLDLDDLVAYGQCVVVGAQHLRFRMEETIALARQRVESIGSDEAARLHEMTEGWPLGLQLALSVAESSGTQALASVELKGGAMRDQFASFMLRNLDPQDVAMLTRVAFAAHLHPDLVHALLPDPDAAGRFARLVRESPVFVASEHDEWVRMHSLARDALGERFEALAAEERASLHGRASQWLEGRGMLDLAAQHALAAGHSQRAYELAERSLYESTMTRGRQGVVLDWLAKLPDDELDRRPRLMLAAAWALATSERHDEAERYVRRILAHGASDDQLRCECALILGGAATFADDPDRFASLHDPWAESPPLKEPLLLRIHANRKAFRALLDGEPALARLQLQQSPRVGVPVANHLERWGDLIVALSYLREGQVILAEQLLRPALAAAEGDLGRRAPFTTMLAALLCAAQWEQDRGEDAAAALANRVDVLERTGLPECVMLGYRTLVRMAVAAQQEHRALELLGALDAVGIARRLPRLRIVSLAEQVRVHARGFRASSCARAVATLDALVAEHSAARGPLWARSVLPLQAGAHAFAAIAAREWRAALEPLVRADGAASAERLGRLHVELLGLRAFVLDRCGERSQPLLQEAIGLAQSHGLRRVFADVHPDLAEWARHAAGAALPIARTNAKEPAASRSSPSMALTPKEREVLELLARNLSNKEIALAMQVGEETIKWHMKNLFAKLDAGTRKQVVARARILGLLSDPG